MIPIVLSRLSSGCSRLAPRDARSLLLPLTGSLLACATCTDQGPPVVDTSPLGDGFKVIGHTRARGATERRRQYDRMVGSGR